MLLIACALRWSWLLGIALVLPIALPAGGYSRVQQDVLGKECTSSFFSGDKCLLQASPSFKSPKLRILQVGTPLRVLRIWQSPDGDEWVHVQITSHEILELPSSRRRGWLNI